MQIRNNLLVVKDSLALKLVWDFPAEYAPYWADHDHHAYFELAFLNLVITETFVCLLCATFCAFLPVSKLAKQSKARVSFPSSMTVCVPHSHLYTIHCVAAEVPYSMRQLKCLIQCAAEVPYIASQLKWPGPSTGATLPFRTAPCSSNGCQAHMRGILRYFFLK